MCQYKAFSITEASFEDVFRGVPTDDLCHAQEKKSCSGPWVLTYRTWDLFHQTHSKSLNTFDGTDPMVDRLKPKVRNTIFFPVMISVQLVKGLRMLPKQEQCLQKVYYLLFAIVM